MSTSDPTIAPRWLESLIEGFITKPERPKPPIERGIMRMIATSVSRGELEFGTTYLRASAAILDPRVRVARHDRAYPLSSPRSSSG